MQLAYDTAETARLVGQSCVKYSAARFAFILP